MNIEVKSVAGATPSDSCKGLNKELFNISRPTTIKDPNDVTKYLFGMLEHPTTGQACLRNVNEEYMLFVNESVDLTALLGYFPSAPQGEIDSLKLYLESSKGTKVRFGNLVPSTAVLISDEDIINDGWIVEDELI